MRRLIARNSSAATDRSALLAQAGDDRVEERTAARRRATERRCRTPGCARAVRPRGSTPASDVVGAVETDRLADGVLSPAEPSAPERSPDHHCRSAARAASSAVNRGPGPAGCRAARSRSTTRACLADFRSAAVAERDRAIGVPRDLFEVVCSRLERQIVCDREAELDRRVVRVDAHQPAGSAYGSGRSSAACTPAKITVVAPMPRPTVTTIVRVIIGRPKQAAERVTRRSCHRSWSIIPLRRTTATAVSVRPADLPLLRPQRRDRVDAQGAHRRARACRARSSGTRGRSRSRA